MEQQIGGPGDSNTRIAAKRYIDREGAETIYELASAADKLGMLDSAAANEAIDLICERIKDLARP